MKASIVLLFFLLLLFGMTSQVDSQQYTFFQDAKSFSAGTVNANIGFSTLDLIIEGESFNLDRQLNLGIDYGISDNFDLKLDYQRGLEFEVNSIALVPKYTIGKLGISPAIGLLFANGSNLSFANPALVYDFVDSEKIGFSGGVNYQALLEDFGNGVLGFYALPSYRIDAITLSGVFYLSPQRIENIQTWTTNIGVELGYIISGGRGGTSTSKNAKGAKKSIWDY